MIAGRYHLLRSLGHGAAATVHLAKDERTGEQVAVKLFAVEARSAQQQFRTEVDLARAVSHTNVVRVMDAGRTEQGRPFIVTEALAGETLGQCLRRTRTLSGTGALHIAREAARGLAAVHRAGIVHRDVKPDNLFLCDERQHDASVKVLDFGFATCSHAKEADERVFGTLEYIAPEQALAEGAGVQADIYSLGVVLFRALTGELPFDACARRGIVAHHLASRIPPPSWLADGLHPQVDAIVLSAVRKHPRNRYPSMLALLEDIDRALAGRPAAGAPLIHTPDAYRPTTDPGREAFRALAEGL